MTEPQTKLSTGSGRRWKRWTLQERQDLRRLLELGRTHAAIASALRRTPAAVSQYIRRYAPLVWSAPRREAP